MYKKILWGIALLSLLASIPLMIDRYNGETSSSQVEVIVDFERLIRVSERSADSMKPQEMMNRLKQAGVTSIAVHEKTVRDLAEQGQIEIYSTNHLNLFDEYEELPDNYTLVLFSTHLSQEQTEEFQMMFLQSMPDDVQLHTWEGHPAVLVDRSINALQNRVLGFNFDEIEKIQEQNVNIVARVQTSRNWNEEWLKKQWARLSQYGVNTVIFDGRDVLGYPSTEKMSTVADLLNEYDMHFSIIEFHEQSGDRYLSTLTDHHVMRLLSVSDQMITTDSVSRTVEMLSLGITERNIRMVYMNPPDPNSFRGIPDAESVITKTNEIIYGTKVNIQEKEYTLGQTTPFYNYKVYGTGWQRFLVIIATLALVSLTCYYIHPMLSYLVWPIGLIGYLAGNLLDFGLVVYQFYALVAAIFTPVLAMIVLIEWLDRGEHGSKRSPILWSILLFVIASLISLLGAVIVTSLLNHLAFIKYIEQFRGVKVLYVAPLLIFVVYSLMKYGGMKWLQRTVELFNQPLRVKHILFAAVILFFIAFYISRSGNEGAVLPFELEFRQLLNDLFGVRPRTKEILLGHPLFILATYLVLKYKKGLWLFFGGIIGQISMVSTFTHLHTPLLISVERTVYGMICGIAVGILLILLWRLAQYVWSKRERLLTHVK